MNTTDNLEHKIEKILSDNPDLNSDFVKGILAGINDVIKNNLEEYKCLKNQSIHK